MPPAATPSEHSLSALDTRDITLPQRLWSWLAKQANDRQCSVDEVVATLIDAHRHPEQADALPAAPSTSPSQSGSSSSAPQAARSNAQSNGQDTAADRLRQMNDRLSGLRDAPDETPRKAQAKRQATQEADSSKRVASSSKDGTHGTAALMDQAMNSLNQSDIPSDGSPSGQLPEQPDADTNSPSEQHEGESGEASMFDVVRENV